MMQQIANHIVDHDPMMVLRRTHDTVRYIRWAWNKEHADPIDEAELRLFLCDEHYGDLTDEQRAFARQGRDNRKSDRFASDERKAGERTGVVNAPVHPTNARSAGIFKGL